MVNEKPISPRPPLPVSLLSYPQYCSCFSSSSNPNSPVPLFASATSEFYFYIRRFGAPSLCSSSIPTARFSRWTLIWWLDFISTHKIWKVAGGCYHLRSTDLALVRGAD